MTVLVAGGTGALGTAVVRELLDAGHACALTWIVDRERERIESELGERVSLVRADLTDPAAAPRRRSPAVDDLEARGEPGRRLQLRARSSTRPSLPTSSA